MARGGFRRQPIETQRPRSRHPYRDTTVFHGALAVLIVIVAWLVGSDIPQAAVVAVIYFVAATGWSWWRFRQRARQPAAKDDQR